MLSVVLRIQSRATAPPVEGGLYYCQRPYDVCVGGRASLSWKHRRLFQQDAHQCEKNVSYAGKRWVIFISLCLCLIFPVDCSRFFFIFTVRVSAVWAPPRCRIMFTVTDLGCCISLLHFYTDWFNLFSWMCGTSWCVSISSCCNVMSAIRLPVNKHIKC